MRMHIIHDGKEYVSPNDPELTEDFVEQFYEQVNKTDKIKMGLDDGGFVVLPERATKNCVIIFK